MSDIKLRRVCDHKLIDFDMSVTGTSPAFIGVLPIPCDGNRSNIFIRSYADDTTAAVVNNYTVGITNYILSNDKSQILFGEYDVDAGMRYPHVYPGQVPYNKYLIDYSVLKENCPKCLGTGYMWDMNIDAFGKATQVSGSNKLKQEIIKILLTEKGTNPYDLEYGSELNTLIGGELTQYSIVLLQKYINDSMLYLSNKQSGLDLDDSERFLRIDNLEITSDSDPSQVNVKIIVLNYAYESVEITLSFNVGGA